jgi:hypothetical protein
VREFGNLGWPDTPFGADKRPFPRKVSLVAATAVLWAADGDRPVPAASALVYLPVPRHRGGRLLQPETLHIGYRVTIIDDPADSPAAADMIDRHLVQGRRHAAALAVHGWDRDALLLSEWAVADTPGIAAVAGILSGQETERGTAPLFDTSRDIAHSAPLLRDGAYRHCVHVTSGEGGLLSTDEILTRYQQVTTGHCTGAKDRAAQSLGLSALCQGLVIALLASEAAGKCRWERPFFVHEVLGNVAWDAFPDVLPDQASVGAAGG